jgi:hypothetical protein
MDREEYKKLFDYKGWKIGDKCYSRVCCGPEFEILDLTFGYAIIDHQPPVPVPVENLYRTEEEYLKEELKRLIDSKEQIEEQIKTMKESLEK